MKYRVTLSTTSDGGSEYMQIISEDQFTTNIVLIGSFKIQDVRKPTEVDTTKL